MKTKSVGLKDIAREAGLAVPTVSLILNGRTNTFIAQGTRERVLEIARKLHYRPKFSHKLINGVSTKTVAIVITEEVHRAEEHIQSLMLRLIEKFESLGLSSYLTTLAKDPVERILDLADRGCEAFVVIGVPPDGSALERIFQERGVQYLGFNSNLDRNVTSDTPSGVEKIIRYFLSQRRHEFRMLVDWEREFFTPNSRFTGLTRVFSELPEATLRSRYLVSLEKPRGDSAEERFRIGYETTRSLMRREGRVNALFFMSDLFALGGAKWLSENNISVGWDVLVAGYNNTTAVKCHPFPISSGDQDVERISDVMIAHLFNEGPCSVSVEPKVVIRPEN